LKHRRRYGNIALAVPALAWACSSGDRATVSGAVCRRFESCQARFPKVLRSQDLSFVCRLHEMRITFLPHALEQMRRRGISEEEARQILEEPVEEGEANFGRFYAQKAIGHRRIRVVLQSWCRRDRGGLRHASQKGRWSVVKISHDKVSGALYFKLREGEYDHTEDYSEKADVYLDVDANGNVLGLEALSFEDLAQAIEESDGELGVPDRVLYLP
jgi:uncharacterized protein YuzE